MLRRRRRIPLLRPPVRRVGTELVRTPRPGMLEPAHHTTDKDLPEWTNQPPLTTPVTTAAESAADDAGPPAPDGWRHRPAAVAAAVRARRSVTCHRAWVPRTTPLRRRARGPRRGSWPHCPGAASHDQWSASISGLLGVRPADRRSGRRSVAGAAAGPMPRSAGWLRVGRARIAVR